MEQILTANNNEVDAVLARNDGMAGGVVAALRPRVWRSRFGSGWRPCRAEPRRPGSQTVSVWKDARQLGKAAGEIAGALAGGTMLTRRRCGEMVRRCEGR